MSKCSKYIYLRWILDQRIFLKHIVKVVVTFLHSNVGVKDYFIGNLLINIMVFQL